MPEDSAVLVCYTTSKYDKNGVHASFNIVWAAVLCGNDASVSSCNLLLRGVVDLVYDIGSPHYSPFPLSFFHDDDLFRMMVDTSL